MQDQELLAHIQDLVAEEHRLMNRASTNEASPDDHSRLKSLAVSLDQCWDLLRQRRGARDAGTDPDDARERDGTTVERYKQ